MVQLPFVVGMLGVGHLLRGRTPVLSNVGASLGVLGGFGHAVFGGITLVYLTMASDQGDRTAYGALVDRVEASPVMMFAGLGLLGTVLGTLLLAIGLWRSRVGARWVPGALVAFLVVEFAGSNLSEWASPVSAGLFLAAFASLAVTVVRSPEAEWSVSSEVRPAAEPALA